MTTVIEIEDAVARLHPGDLAMFRAWFAAFEAERLDRRIEDDAMSGRLDHLAEEALTELREGSAESCETFCQPAVLDGYDLLPRPVREVAIVTSGY